MRYTYPCTLTPEEDGGYSVSFPDVPESLTCGDDRAEALEMAQDALTVALGMYVQVGEDIPVPSQASDGQELVAVPSIIAAKLALYTAMRRQGIAPGALAERLNQSESSVRRLLNLEHQSHIGQVEEALRAVGRSLVVEDRVA